jgi:hypothetical protein
VIQMIAPSRISCGAGETTMRRWSTTSHPHMSAAIPAAAFVTRRAIAELLTGLGVT